MKSLKQIIEAPHVKYLSSNSNVDDFKNKAIDFHIERMKISKDEKQKLIRAFNQQGIVAQYKDKWIKFTPYEATLLNMKPRLPILPKDWAKYIKLF